MTDAVGTIRPTPGTRDAMTARNTICLWYDRDAEAAARFYAATFPESAVGAVHRAPADFRRAVKGDVLTVEFTVLGTPCIGLNGGPLFQHSEAFSFRSRRRRRKRTLLERIVGNGGAEAPVAWQGQMGLSWQITPRVLTEVSPTGSAIARRVFEASADAQDRRRGDRGGTARLTRIEDRLLDAARELSAALATLRSRHRSPTSTTRAVRLGGPYGRTYAATAPAASGVVLLAEPGPFGNGADRGARRRSGRGA